MKPEDAALVRRCLEGEKDAFGTLVERYQRPIFNVALRMLGDLEDASDVTQTVFVKAFEKLRGYDSRYKFYSWIYRIAVNESIDLFNSRQSNDRVDEQHPANTPSPEDTCGGSEVSRGIQRALMAIEIDHRSVIVLRHFRDLSYRDMSEVLGIPERTVKSRLFTARQRLKERLRRDGILS